MKCDLCGSRMKKIVTDLPFKFREGSIVILKDLPVLQCQKCSEYLLEDSVVAAVDRILARADGSAELEIIRYAA